MLTAQKAKELACRSDRMKSLFNYIEMHAKIGGNSCMLSNLTDEEHDTLVDLGYTVTCPRSSRIYTIAWR